MPELDDDIPPGVPGRVAVCELCGHYFNNFQLTGDMKWCQRCSKPSLRSGCPKCGADIPVPPQLKCFSCGTWLTIMPMKQLPDGSIVPATIEEPDAKTREQLESKGNNWLEVVKGKAEGPTVVVPEAQRTKPPSGWDSGDFAALLGKALLAHGQAKPIVVPEVWYCEKCELPQIIWKGDVKCMVCGGALVPETGQGLDKADDPG